MNEIKNSLEILWIDFRLLLVDIAIDIIKFAVSVQEKVNNYKAQILTEKQKQCSND